MLFLQNHDQVGNRPFGDRLIERADPTALEAAIALQLLCPQVPLLFMGEEDGCRGPFLYFTDHHGALADAVREGRRQEFAGFKGFAAGEGTASIPDPNAPETFERSRPTGRDSARRALYERLLALRARRLVPYLGEARSLGAEAIGRAGVVARWRLGGGQRLTLVSVLADEVVPVTLAMGELLFESRVGAAADLRRGRLHGPATVALLETLS